MIPTLGRIVLFSEEPDSKLYPAIITHVWDEKTVNLAVCNDGDRPLKPRDLHPCQVALYDPEVDSAGASWRWPPRV